MTSYELEPQETEYPDQILVSVGGELDLTNAREFEDRLLSLVAERESLLIDLRRVAFIDSAALHVLFRMARRLSKARFGLVVERESPITRTLELVGVPDVVTVAESTDELAAVLA